MDEMITPEPMPLKPCPFCGGEAEKKKYFFQHKLVYVVMCGGCGSRSPMFLEEAKERAIEAWNRRANDENS